MEETNRRELVGTENREERNCCRSCGKRLPNKRKKYCAATCSTRFRSALGVAKGLLKALNTNYAAVRIGDDRVCLDALVHNSKSVRRFTLQRNLGEAPADSFRGLVHDVGKIWDDELDRTNSRRAASEAALKASARCDACPEEIIPAKCWNMKNEGKRALKVLGISQEELDIGGMNGLLDKYKRLAKTSHPDCGGNREKMVKLNFAKDVLIAYLREAKEMSSRNRLLPKKGMWCFIGKTGSWIPPM